MAKKRPQTKAKRPQPAGGAGADGAIPVVGGREPCPCGSGRRYKACHGREAAHAVTELVRRPFEGLPGECDWVALRELVPAATVELTLKDGLPEDVPSVTLATVLPMAWPALRRDDGSVLLGLQNDTASGDISRDLADTLQRALVAEPGTPVQGRRAPADGPRLQELIDPEGPFEPVVHSGFEFWVPDAENATPEVAASLERANAAAIPTVRLSGVDAAYWCETPEKNHLRWVMPHPEERLLDALARLHAAGRSSLGEGTRLVGSFRAHGLTVPVWDLPSGVGAQDVEKPAAEFAERLAAALAVEEPLTAEERRARGGLTNRQVTLS
ncbi:MULTISPECIES: DUF5926 family protein [Streptomyces]|uniref:SEC-C motif-containing protein n=1 Tax=Streptomyces misionensis TaxID=67331 RepID=A0A1H4YTI8_9ACTN|nr:MULTISPECIES: DUF5926 family protein [Streptomyces]SED20628.1 SEC-C motif-containing protein [Streptomyces misionensis]SFY51421.1 hypothetical protein STEPF1_04683 [Streptomyces sp. F-1]